MVAFAYFCSVEQLKTMMTMKKTVLLTMLVAMVATAASAQFYPDGRPIPPSKRGGYTMTHHPRSHSHYDPSSTYYGFRVGLGVATVNSDSPYLDGNKAMDELNLEGALKFDIGGEEIVLSKEDLLIETVEKDGFVSESDNKVTVVLDTNLTPELIEEGFVRELISKIQTMRNEAGFEVMDKIVVYAKDNDKLKGIMVNNSGEIKHDVLAEEIKFGETDGYEKAWDINGEKVVLGVKKI